SLHTLEKQRSNGRYQEIYRYRYVNQIPLRDAQPALLVNWCELTLTKSSDKSIIYRNAFITRHEIQADNVTEVVTAGRARWKVENENNNVLKTKGYHLEHNFGHGQKHLSTILVTLNLLAFLFHTVLQLVDRPYQQIRKRRGTRKTFFNDIRTLTTYFVFEGWQHLIAFMLSASAPWKSFNTS
ncbi:MAG: ISNCY family transposase, partial [Microcystaceae cyanobacterium]